LWAEEVNVHESHTYQIELAVEFRAIARFVRGVTDVEVNSTIILRVQISLVWELVG
jgi:hypothetical protein